MNKTGKMVVALASVFCFVLLGGSAFAQGYSQEFPGGTVGAFYQAKGWDTFEGSWMIGYEVTDTDGGSLGQISSFVIDNTNGRIALVVLSDVPNLGAEQLAIPFSSLMRTGANTFEFNPGSMALKVDDFPQWPYTNHDLFVYTVTSPPAGSDLYGIPSKIDAEWVSYIYQHYGQEPYWTEQGMQSPKELELYQSTKLMGAQVQTPMGEEVAMVNDLVIDSSDGHIAFVVLSDIPGRGDTLVAVPFGALSRSGEMAFVLNTTKEQLAAAPSFNEFADLSNPTYADNVYRYFGLTPYWIEGGAMGTPTTGQPMSEERSDEEYMEP